MPEHLLPEEIEARSFAILSAELGETSLPEEELTVLKRVIHTTADFEYKHNLYFSPGGVQAGLDALKGGAAIVTDTNMAKAGVSKPGLARLGGQVHCFMADEDIAQAAREQQTTRAAVSMEKAAHLTGELIVAVGNAPTALIALDRLMKEGKIKPALIIAAPVGFVNVVESKELILGCGIPHIVAKGRKGGSNVAAAICNALIYQAGGR